MFNEDLGKVIDRQDHSIADGVYSYFPGRLKVLRRVEERLAKLSPTKPLPPVLVSLRDALDRCRGSRQIEKTVFAVRDNLDTLRDGLPVLARYDNELTEANIAAVNTAAKVVSTQIKQLRDFNSLEDVAKAARIEEALRGATPWLNVPTVSGDVSSIVSDYQAVRQALINNIGSEAEGTRSKLKQVDGFSDLNSAASNQVLHTITAVTPETTAKKTHPTLKTIRVTFTADLADAYEEAQERLDELLNKKADSSSLVQIQMNIRNRIIEKPEQLEALIEEMRSRVLAKLKNGERVRILPL
jgi:hypothetical protein